LQAENVVRKHHTKQPAAATDYAGHKAMPDKATMLRKTQFPSGTK